MIFLSFVLLNSIFLVSAHFCGDIGYVINLDSIVIIVLGALIFGLGLNDRKSFILGVKDMFLFGKKDRDSRNDTVARYYLSLTIITPIIGLCSTIQGIMCGIFGNVSYTLSQTICLAGFTTVYGVIISSFLFYPIYLLNRAVG